jgi:hypothetical protein
VITTKAQQPSSIFNSIVLVGHCPTYQRTEAGGQQLSLCHSREGGNPEIVSLAVRLAGTFDNGRIRAAPPRIFLGYQFPGPPRLEGEGSFPGHDTETHCFEQVIFPQFL